MTKSQRRHISYLWLSMLILPNAYHGNCNPLGAQTVRSTSESDRFHPILANLSDSSNTTSSSTLTLPLNSVMNLTFPQPKCSAGGILSPVSCEDAISQIPRGGAAMLDSWGNQISTPFRVSSCESVPPVQIITIDGVTMVGYDDV